MRIVQMWEEEGLELVQLMSHDCVTSKKYIGNSLSSGKPPAKAQAVMSYKWMLALQLAVVALCRPEGVRAEIEDYAEKWNRTIYSRTNPPSGDISAQALSCKGIQFNTPDGTCTLDPRPEAKSVHLLTPADIGIVAALGDSITAAFGAKASNVIDFPTRESRGVSWCIGGDEGSYQNCATLPNILKAFNPNVYGASTGSGDEKSSGANLNRAVSGAESTDILRQAQDLVGKIRALPVEQQNQWKLVTLWIGGNDLCKRCGSGGRTADEYFNNIFKGLEYLRDNLPRTLVNVPQALDVTKIAGTTGLICGIVHWFACDCAGSRSDETSARAKEYIEKLEELDNNPLWENDEQFTVVVQPFFKKIELPRDGNNNVDMSFFAPDCFHMSVKGHRAIAAGLWNNMVNPKDSKDDKWVPHNPTLQCPDPAQPYFYTSKTQALLEAQSEGGGFNAQSQPEQEKSTADNSESNSESKDGWSLGQIFGVAIGTAATAYIVAVAAVVAIAGGVWMRKCRRRANPNNEAIPLVKNR